MSGHCQRAFEGPGCPSTVGVSCSRWLRSPPSWGTCTWVGLLSSASQGFSSVRGQSYQPGADGAPWRATRGTHLQGPAGAGPSAVDLTFSVSHGSGRPMKAKVRAALHLVFPGGIKHHSAGALSSPKVPSWSLNFLAEPCCSLGWGLWAQPLRAFPEGAGGRHMPQCSSLVPTATIRHGMSWSLSDCGLTTRYQMCGHRDCPAHSGALHLEHAWRMRQSSGGCQKQGQGKKGHPGFSTLAQEPVATS